MIQLLAGYAAIAGGSYLLAQVFGWQVGSGVALVIGGAVAAATAVQSDDDDS